VGGFLGGVFVFWGVFCLGGFGWWGVWFCVGFGWGGGFRGVVVWGVWCFFWCGLLLLVGGWGVGLGVLGGGRWFFCCFCCCVWCLVWAGVFVCLVLLLWLVAGLVVGFRGCGCSCGGFDWGLGVVGAVWFWVFCGWGVFLWFFFLWCFVGVFCCWWLGVCFVGCVLGFCGLGLLVLFLVGGLFGVCFGVVVFCGVGW